jgi:DNA-binding MarR family transcriptional regulator
MVGQRCKPTASSDLEKLNKSSNKPTGVAYMIGRLDQSINNHFRKALAPIGLTVAQYTALSVFCSSGQLSSAKLAERTMVSPQAANALIKGMEHSGWIKRSPDPEHGRIIHLSLTEEGEDLLDECNKVISKLERQMLKDLSDQQISDLHSQLRSALNALRQI